MRRRHDQEPRQPCAHTSCRFARDRERRRLWAGSIDARHHGGRRPRLTTSPIFTRAKKFARKKIARRKPGEFSLLRQRCGQGTVDRPRKIPTTAEIRNRTTATKKMILAISIETPAMPPKPRTAAINATTRKVR